LEHLLLNQALGHSSLEEQPNRQQPLLL